MTHSINPHEESKRQQIKHQHIHQHTFVNVTKEFFEVKQRAFNNLCQLID
ncbi:hypothetical protein KW474_10485 [Vibrio fluvialis]|nr:hypothetical protein [Vibrio fluvialis]